MAAASERPQGVVIEGALLLGWQVRQSNNLDLMASPDALLNGTTLYRDGLVLRAVCCYCEYRIAGIQLTVLVGIFLRG